MGLDLTRTDQQEKARADLDKVLTWNRIRDEARHDVTTGIIGSTLEAGFDHGEIALPDPDEIDSLVEAELDVLVGVHPLINAKGLSAGGPSACFGNLDPYVPRYSGFCWAPASTFGPYPTYPTRYLWGKYWWNGADSLCAFLNAGLIYDAGQSPYGNRWNFRWDSHWAVGALNSFFGISGPNGPNVAYRDSFVAVQVAITT